MQTQTTPIEYNRTPTEFTPLPTPFNPWLNSREVRQLASQELLIEPHSERPDAKLFASQTTAVLFTYHRTRTPDPRRECVGAWRTRRKNITLTPKIARILLTKFRYPIASGSRQNLSIVALGLKSHRRVRKSKIQAVFA